MKKKFFFTAIFAFFICFPVGSIASQHADSSEEIIYALKARIENLEKSLQETKQQLEALVETRQKVDHLEAEQKKIKQIATAQQPAEKNDDGIKIGGAVRVQYNVKDWDGKNKKRSGDFTFDTFRFDLNGKIKDFILSAQYRFYPQDDWHAPHHAWVGYNLTDDLQAQVGIHQVPFGLQPFASHNFWFSGAYYVGLEDDYDMGVKLLYKPGPWNLALAFYKNEELGNAGDAGRYSVDVIDNADGGYAGAQAAGNRESNQVNLRVARTFDHGELGNTELGISGQWGQLYNDITDKNGDHWAAAAHMNGNYGRWNLQLMYAAYGYNQENPDTWENSAGDILPVDGDIITMGAYSYSWGAPAAGQIGIANLAYTLPLEWGPIDSLTFYSDNTVIYPHESRFSTIWQNVLGCLVATGPVYTYIDLISGEDMIFMGGDMVGDTDASSGRNTRLNINIGYYF
jgi:hypothetical protein